MDFNPLSQRLLTHVRAIAAAPRPCGSQAHCQAQEYIHSQWADAGFSVQRITLPSQAGLNLLTEPIPNDPSLPLLILAAHYDSIPDSPGADDNASAVAALLEIGRALHPSAWRPNVYRARLQLAAYDLEEAGLIGSFFHVRQLQKKMVPVAGMLSLEMLGYCDSRPNSQRLPPMVRGLYPEVGNFIGVIGNDGSRELACQVTDALRSIPDLPVENLVLPDQGQLLPVTRLSDHTSFWDAGYPALMVTDTSFFRNPHYHQASDRPETLDYAFLSRVTLGLIQASRQLLQG